MRVLQWMTAARGIVHEEYHSPRFAKEGGTLEMCQLWVNLPRALKMGAPRYQALSESSMPRVELDAENPGAGEIQVRGKSHIIDMRSLTGP